MNNDANGPPLVDNPFYRESSYRKNHEGCWDGNHAAMQLEDCTDLFVVLFSYDSYQLVFEIDHSHAHKRFADNVLIVKHFNLKPGGSAPFVHDVAIVSTSLGPCDW